jgi:multiple sugar transport system substrate-binding protein
MRKNGKLYTLLSVIFVLIVSVALAGCGNNDASSGSEDSSDKVTLRFSMWDTLKEDETDFITAFEEKYPNIELELVNIPEDYSQKINSMLIGGNAPDVILSWEADINRFAENGAIDSLDEYIADTTEFSMDEFIPAVNEINTTGETYGLPWVYATEFLYYNKDLFDAAGVEYPNENWTWADFQEAAKKLTVREGDQTVQWGVDAISFPGIWYSAIGAAGDDVVKDGKLDLGDGLRKALEFENQLTNVDKVAPLPSSGGQVADLFAAGKAAMTRQGSWYTLAYGENDFNWDIAPLPKEERSYASLHTGFFTINSQSKHKEEAWKFIEFMMGDEGQKMLSSQFHNPSARTNIAANGDYQVPGKNGPTSWDVFEKTEDAGRFGYVLVNPTVTDDLVADFNAVLLGQKTIDEVIDGSVPAAQAQLDEQ